MEAGDVVVHKETPRVPMTVETVVGPHYVECVWFVGYEVYKRMFRTSELLPDSSHVVKDFGTHLVIQHRDANGQYSDVAEVFKGN